MKQATGSNTPQSINKVSIQLTLDGHFFGACAVREFPGDGPVEVELLTPRTTLVPEEFSDEACAGELLAAAGMAALPGERAVWSAPQQNAVAVMAAAEDALAAVHERLGDRARYTTPLLCVPQASVPTVWMYYAAGLLYIKVYDGKLRFAEVVPAPRRGRPAIHARTARKRIPAQGLHASHRKRRRPGVETEARRIFQTDRMRIVSGKIQGPGHQPAPQPAGAADNRFRQGEPLQRPRQSAGFRGVRRAGPLRGNRLDQL